MPAFTKLIRGAEHLKDLAAEAKALPFPDAPQALTVYHGSPHVFDQFDFENNLRRGEGAMAYGPGGYLTGNRPLAEHYANSLASRNEWVPQRGTSLAVGPLSQTHEALQQAFSKDPDATLAWLTAREVNRSRGYGLGDDSFVLKPQNWESGYGSRPAVGEQRATRFDPINFEAALKQMSSNGLRPNAFTGAVTSGRVNSGRALGIVDAGRALGDMPSPVFGSTSLGMQRTKAGRSSWGSEVPEWADPNLAAMTNDVSRSTFGVANNNLRALAAAASDIPGPRYKGGMGGEFGIDFGPGWRDRIKNWTGPQTNLPASYFDRPEVSKNIYQARLNASPNSMLLYDLPLEEQAPQVQGALGQLFDRFPKLAELRKKYGDNWDSALKGSDVVRALPQDATGMRAMSESGIPATAYLRAGPRRDGVQPAFDPSDYNFVIHNQDVLDMLQRTKKAQGGLV